MLEGITPLHLIVVLVVAMLVLGPGKLPETGAALGKAMREFRHAMSDDVTGSPASQGKAGEADATPTTAPPGAS